MTIYTIAGRPIQIGPGFVARPTSVIETGSVDILHRANTSFAPESMQFGVDLTGTALDLALQGVFDPKLQLYYFWNFGDPGTFQYLSGMNTLGWDDANTSIAPRPQHTFGVGTFTVSVSVYGVVGGVLRRVDASTSVTVADPDTVFAGADTIFVTSNTDTTGAPAGATIVTNVTDLTTVYQANIAGQETTPKRLMLHDGQTFSFSGLSLGTNGNIWPTTLITKAGTGANPTVNQTGAITFLDNGIDNGNGGPYTQFPNRTHDFVITGVDFFGTYDSTTQTGDANSGHCNLFEDISPNVLAWHRCTVNGFALTLNLFGSTDNGPGLCAINDCEMRDYRQSIVFVFQTQSLAMTGSLIGSLPTSRVGPNDGTYNGGFAHRSDSDIAVVDKCRMMNKQGWFPPAPDTNPAGRVDFNSCLRLNALGRYGSNTSVVNCVLEGGFNVIQTQSVNPEPNQAAAMILIRSCIVVGDFSTRNLITGGCGGTVLDNVTGIFTNTSVIDQPVGYLFAYSNDAGDDAGPGINVGDQENLDGPMEARNCSMISFRNETPAAQSTIMNNGTPQYGVFTNEFEAGSLIWASNGDTSQGPLTQTDIGVTLLNTVGYTDRDGSVTAGTASPANSVLEYAPTGASPAIGAVSGLVSPFSRNDRQRGATDNLGAV